MNENYFYYLVDPFFNLTPWQDLNKILGIFIFALIFSLVSKYLSKFKPEDELNKIVSEIRRISELSKDALDIEDYKMYAILQKQGNELLYQYYLVISRMAILEVSPHLLGICLSEIGLRGGAAVILPFSVPLLGSGIRATILYIVCAIFIHKILFKKFSKFLNFLGRKKLKQKM